jgi:adenine-specific DNA-methyltransferase
VPIILIGSYGHALFIPPDRRTASRAQALRPGNNWSFLMLNRTPSRAYAPLPLNQILLGDCCEVLQGLPPESVDFCLTDPPYMVNYVDRSGRSIRNDNCEEWIKPAFEGIFRALKDQSFCVSFYGNTKTDVFFDAWKSAGFRVIEHFVFPKRYTSSSRYVRRQNECAYLLGKGNVQPPKNVIGDVIDWTYSGNKWHPTQKPTQCLTPLIESFCPLGGVVLDPFGGSASTGIAARSVCRNFVGIEIDPEYHMRASARLAGHARAMGGAFGVEVANHD